MKRAGQDPMHGLERRNIISVRIQSIDIEPLILLRQLKNKLMARKLLRHLFDYLGILFLQLGKIMLTHFQFIHSAHNKNRDNLPAERGALRPEIEPECQKRG